MQVTHQADPLRLQHGGLGLLLLTRETAAQGVLRTTQHLHRSDIDQIGGGHAQTADKGIIDISGHRFIGKDIAATIGTADATDRHGRGTVIDIGRNGEARHRRRQILQRADIVFSQAFPGQGRDGDGHVLDAFAPLLGGDDDLFQHTGIILCQGRQGQRGFVQRFAEVDLTPNLYSILALLEANGACRMSDIGSALGILQTNLVKRVDELVDRGYVTREADPVDRRAKALVLTPAGREFLVRLHAIHDELESTLVERLGSEDHAKLIELLQKLLFGEELLLSTTTMGE